MHKVSCYLCSKPSVLVVQSNRWSDPTNWYAMCLDDAAKYIKEPQVQHRPINRPGAMRGLNVRAGY